MTRDRLWTLLAALLPVLGATIAPMSTVDLAYQVRVGDLMRASGSVLRADPLTFTAAGQAWLNQQWGAGDRHAWGRAPRKRPRPGVLAHTVCAASIT